jgi:enoyl-CoA hydratase
MRRTLDPDRSPEAAMNTDVHEDGPVLLAEDIGPVRRLTLNRPASLNALSGELMDALEEAFEAAADDDEVRAVILRGAGRAFCAGYDLKQDAEEGTKDAAEWHRELDRDTRRLLRILELPKPVVASVHSYCLAGGMDLMLACDLAVAAEDAVFGYVDIRFGSGIVSMFLPWIVGVRAAKELVFTGQDRIPAAEAHRIGLVNRVVSRDELDDATMALAEEIARNEPFVVRTMKASINRVWQLSGLRAALDANIELDVMIETANLPARDEFRRITQEEGLKAAIAWRDARYRDRP